MQSARLTWKMEHLNPGEMYGKESDRCHAPLTVKLISSSSSFAQVIHPRRMMAPRH